MNARAEDWESLYLAAIDAHTSRAFIWGESDCFLFPLDVVDAMTGSSFATEARGLYSNRLGAFKALNARGWKNIAEAFASKFEEVPPALAGRGDIGTIEVGDLCCGVVVIGEDVIGRDEQSGMVRVPRAHLTRAFKIG